MGQNGIFPPTTRPYGLAQVFVQRRALCRATDFDSYHRLLTVPGWSAGASLNFVDFRAKRMVNVEVYGDRSSTHEVVANYSHFNLYKDPDMIDLNAGIVSYEVNSS